MGDLLLEGAVAVLAVGQALDDLLNEFAEAGLQIDQVLLVGLRVEAVEQVAVLLGGQSLVCLEGSLELLELAIVATVLVD